MVILLPGLICDSTLFAAQVAAFPEARAIDGYGDRESLETMAAHVLDQAPARFDLFGHSMGGRIALEVYRLAPERVCRLALASTGVHGVGEDEPEKRMALRDIGREQGFDALVDAWLPPMIGPPQRNDPVIVKPLRDMCLRMGQAMFERHVSALLNRPGVGALLGRIACPTLVMTGALDTWSPPAQHERIASEIASSERVIVPGAGHMLPVEKPDSVNAAIAGWLSMPAQN